jgi:endonuclease G, mitochondrial
MRTVQGAPCLSVLAAVILCASLAVAQPFDACPEYIAYGIPGDSGQQLCRLGYALAHDADRKTPDWVAEHLTVERVTASMKRKNYF